jgi:hypothetical protein
MLEGDCGISPRYVEHRIPKDHQQQKGVGDCSSRAVSLAMVLANVPRAATYLKELGSKQWKPLTKFTGEISSAPIHVLGANCEWHKLPGGVEGKDVDWMVAYMRKNPAIYVAGLNSSNGMEGYHTICIDTRSCFSNKDASGLLFDPREPFALVLNRQQLERCFRLAYGSGGGQCVGFGNPRVLVVIESGVKSKRGRKRHSTTGSIHSDGGNGGNVKKLRGD